MNERALRYVYNLNKMANFFQVFLVYFGEIAKNRLRFVFPERSYLIFSYTVPLVLRANSNLCLKLVTYNNKLVECLSTFGQNPVIRLDWTGRFLAQLHPSNFFSKNPFPSAKSFQFKIFSEAMFYENYLRSDFHTNTVICLLVKMASKTFERGSFCQ